MRACNEPGDLSTDHIVAMAGCVVLVRVGADRCVGCMAPVLENAVIPHESQHQHHVQFVESNCRIPLH